MAGLLLPVLMLGKLISCLVLIRSNSLANNRIIKPNIRPDSNPAGYLVGSRPQLNYFSEKRMNYKFI